MLRRTIGIFRRACLCALSAMVVPVVAARADDVARGSQLAHVLCVQCHLNEGQGEKQGPMGVPSFAAVANRPGQTFDATLAWLKSVPPMMPNHHLTQDEMYALADYIMSLRKEQ